MTRGFSRKFSAIVTGAVPRILLGSLVGQGTLLAVSPLLTRIYEPRDFAALAAFTGLSTVLGALITLSWERAIVIPRSEAQARGVALLGVLTVLTLSVVVAMASWLAGPSLDRLFETRVFGPVWWLLPVTVAIMGMYSILSSLLVRAKQYGKLAARNGLLGVSQALSSVLLGVAGFGPSGLISSMGVGRAVALLGVVPGLRPRRKTKVTAHRLLVLASRYRRFPLVATWSRAFNVIGLQLPPLLIVAIYGSMEAGLFALTLRVLAAPIGIVADAVSQYFEGAFAERVRGRSTRLRSLIFSVSGRLAFVAAPPAIIVALFAPGLFAFVFGENWRGAGEFAQIVVWFYAAQLTVSPITKALLVLEKQYQQLAWDVARAVSTAAVVVAPLFFGGSLAAALLLLTATQIVLYAVAFYLCVRAAGIAERPQTSNAAHE